MRAVADYYSRRLAEHGTSARGVDWSSPESQQLRFDVLLEGIDWAAGPSLLDYGCGYGALASHLDRLGVRCGYQGYDIAESMVAAARREHAGQPDRRFTADAAELEPSDHVVASGIFNVKLDADAADWDRHVIGTLERLWSLARRTVAFNMLPPASSPELARADLYYADPDAIARHCAERLGGHVELRREYGLWEFAVLVSLEPSDTVLR